MSINDEISVIVQELMNAKKQGFTGKYTFTLHLNKGGIGRIELNIEKFLKKDVNPQKKTWHEE